jgi:hypothetical protein
MTLVERDLAMSEPPDLSMSEPPDLAKSTPPDLTMPPPPPDLATPPDMTQCKHNTPSSTCGTFPQCGCPAGQMCSVQDTTGKALCVVAGTTPPFGACTTDSNCSIGTACVDGTCTPYCDTNTDCDNGVCVGVQSGTTPIPGMNVCTLNCDPQNPNMAAGSFGACGAATSCVPGPAPGGNTYCESPTKASGTQDKACNDYKGCAPGFTCQDAGLGLYCSKYCKVGVTGQCPSGTSCYAFSPKLYAGTTQYGYCY